ncbi:ABC transporter ATP-binding protein [Veillonella intestinalis]|uniref:ABC transporter ATP-binding protein n=1 Tax=Veillonella intestinalis TaxID=2941341 RepID=UPI002041BFA5|nr:ABC transporter ATP-binding protein [Veillonella intestinalis]
MKQIVVENLTYHVGDTQILNQLSLTIPADKFVGLMGPNGCGKSTLLKHLYRVISRQQGRIQFDETPLEQIPLREAAKRIGVMGQFHTINFDFTVWQIVMMGRTPYKKGFEDDTEDDVNLAMEALRKVGMWDRAHRSFASLSGGEQQRVMLARVLCQEPEYLILDEPTNHLDITYQLELLEVIKGLGVGVIAALHDLNLASLFCDELFIMKRGQLVAQGTPHEIVREPLIREVYEVSSTVSYHEDGIPMVTYERQPLRYSAEESVYRSLAQRNSERAFERFDSGGQL